MKFLFPLSILIALSGAFSAEAFDAESGCVQCHGDREKMRALGAEGMYLDPAQVDREVGMKGVPTCVSCHLGDPEANSPEKAHAGLLRPLLMVMGPDLAGESMHRNRLGFGPLEVKGKKDSALLPTPDPEAAEAAGVKTVRGIFWHDRDPQTFAYSPEIARRTCGTCHAKETEEYNRSGMGLLKFQRANRSFADPLPGPHNCGAWFGGNHESLAAETAVPFTPAQNAANDRNCNVCHPGCNDCHFQPFKGEGRHRFGRPEPLSCYGGQRGVICHAGPMERRRGAGFLRDEYAFPKTLYAGVHAEKGLNCLDCHSLAQHQSGHMASAEARQSCRRCHGEIVSAVEASDHAKVDCAACHVDEVGGYQFTFWGPGSFAGNETPYAKHAGYYGVRDLPTLIRNPEGRWMAYKPYPMAVLNQKRELSPTGVLFRAIPETTIPGTERLGEPASFSVSRSATETNDAYIAVGTRKDLPGGNKAVLWIQMDKVSHALGFGRECESCHASHAQIAASSFRYVDDRNVADAVLGSYRITADEKGMRYTDLAWSPIQPRPGRKLEDFALFAVLPPEAWNVAGVDLSIPFDEKKYAAAAEEAKDLLKEIETLEKKMAEDPARLKDLRTVKAVSIHNAPRGREMLEKWKKSDR